MSQLQFDPRCVTGRHVFDMTEAVFPFLTDALQELTRVVNIVQLFLVELNKFQGQLTR